MGSQFDDSPILLDSTVIQGATAILPAPLARRRAWSSVVGRTCLRQSGRRKVAKSGGKSPGFRVREHHLDMGKYPAW